MRKTILWVAAALCPIQLSAEKPIRMAPPGTPNPRKRLEAAPNKEQLWKAEKLQKQLEQEVSRLHKGNVKSEVREGPAGTLLVRAWSEGAYPGTGVMSAFVDKNAVSYGIHGERDFADFVRAEGWLKAEPPVEDFMRLVDFAQFEAVVMHLDHLEQPRLTNESQGLVLRFIRGYMPSGAYPTEVIVEKTGGVRIIQKKQSLK